MKVILEKFKESVYAVIPITVIVVALNFIFKPMPMLDLVSFLVCALFLMFGMSLYSLGSDVAMTAIGAHIGTNITKTKKIGVILIISFILGFIVTIAEPDLMVLASQVGDSIPNMVLIVTIAVGVGIFLLLSMLRTFFKIKLNLMLLIFYAILFGFAIFVDAEFVPLAFDSGGVTTGPITVPFIMALGVGVASNLGGDDSRDNSFGAIALCSCGPILMVLVLGLFYRPEMNADTVHNAAMIDYNSFGEVLGGFFKAMPTYFGEVALALGPIVVFFLIFHFASAKVTNRQLVRILAGIVYTYIGLVIFLTAANVGFMAAGQYIGNIVAAQEHKWLLIPIGMLVGACIVIAEPAVHVLNKQVEEITDGHITRRTMLIVLAVSIASSIGLAMVRVLTHMAIWWILVPGYVIALGLSFFVPQMFTGIGFDSGGVASGPMTTTFLLPFALGACSAIGGNPFRDAFGVVAFVAMTPLIAIQVLGAVYKIKIKHHERVSVDIRRQLEAEGDDIIELTGSRRHHRKEEGNV